MHAQLDKEIALGLFGFLFKESTVYLRGQEIGRLVKYCLINSKKRINTNCVFNTHEMLQASKGKNKGTKKKQKRRSIWDQSRAAENCTLLF